MRYERVKITRDPHTVYNRTVLPWEVAILEFTFGEGNVHRFEDEFETNELEYPEPSVEFQRLQQAYGSDPQSGVPYVASVYGQASAGVNHLRRAMQEAIQAEVDAKPKAPAKRKVVSRKTRVATGDPLLT
jgi:hypothetical protein